MHTWLSHWLLPHLKRKHRCWKGDSAGKGAFHKCVRALVQPPRNKVAGRYAVRSYNYSISIGRWEAETREFPEVLGSSCLASTAGWGWGKKVKRLCLKQIEGREGLQMLSSNLHTQKLSTASPHSHINVRAHVQFNFIKEKQSFHFTSNSSTWEGAERDLHTINALTLLSLPPSAGITDLTHPPSICRARDPTQGSVQMEQALARLNAYPFYKYSTNRIFGPLQSILVPRNLWALPNGVYPSYKGRSSSSSLAQCLTFGMPLQVCVWWLVYNQKNWKIVSNCSLPQYMDRLSYFTRVCEAQIKSYQIQCHEQSQQSGVHLHLFLNIVYVANSPKIFCQIFLPASFLKRRHTIRNM